MIRESHLDANLNRLSGAFGSRLIIRPPASAEDVAKLEQIVGPLPREYVVFLLTCDGLRIRPSSKIAVPQWHLWHVQEITTAILDPQGPGVSPGLLSFCGDPSGLRDCMVTGRGPTEGTIVRWDPLTPEVELMSSGFGCYFDRWTEYMIERWAEHDSEKASDDRPEFTGEYLGQNDPRLLSLRKMTLTTESLRTLEHIVPSGDDFE